MVDPALKGQFALKDLIQVFFLSNVPAALTALLSHLFLIYSAIMPLIISRSMTPRRTTSLTDMTRIMQMGAGRRHRRDVRPDEGGVPAADDGRGAVADPHRQEHPAHVLLLHAAQTGLAARHLHGPAVRRPLDRVGHQLKRILIPCSLMYRAPLFSGQDLQTHHCSITS